MSWYSDGERFMDYDPPYCKDCTYSEGKAYCDRCKDDHEREYEESKRYWEEQREIEMEHRRD